MPFTAAEDQINVQHNLGQVRKNSLQELLWSYIRNESFGGILLFFCVILALVVSNSRLADWYFSIWDINVGFLFGNHYMGMNLLHWINDALMSLFFLLVGLEMKRDILWGELAGFKKISFSFFAALGGLLIPSLIYYFFTMQGDYAHGFGVAMSTDTAFALGIILLFGRRVPAIMKVFLVTLAVADDFGAITVIAVFYSEGLSIPWLLCALLIFLVLTALKMLWDVRSLVPYIIGGVILWYATHNSGVHATVAAVALAFLIPGRPQIEQDYFREVCRRLDAFNDNGYSVGMSFKQEEERMHLLDEIAHMSIQAKNPLLRLEYFLQPLCAYIIVPLFAFANAGVAIDLNTDFLKDGILVGIIAGLVIGKPIGILSFAWASEKIGISKRPDGLTYNHILGVGLIAGIGFTMSIFVANLAFSGEIMEIAKVGILLASLIAGLLGVLFIYLSTRVRRA